MNSARRRSALKKSAIVKIAIGFAIAIAVGAVLVFALRSHVSDQYGSSASEVQSAQVTVGSISTTVSGSGTLTNEESEDTSISDTVDVTEIYVNAGETVKKGDMLASVDSASVVKAMKEVQDEIDSIDEKIAELEESEIADTITAGVDGRVKKIFAAAGDSVADVMYDNGSLMLISADGYLAIDVKADNLAAGDEVGVTTKDGTELTGTVDAAWADTATILVDDSAASYGVKATVYKDGTKIGTGKLYIHEQVAVTGFTGTVSAVSVSENDLVYAGDTLFAIEGASSTVSYATLLEQRSELEEELKDLVTIHKEGAVYAQANGLITAISQTEDSTTTTTTAATSRSNGGSSSSSGSSQNTSGQTTTTTVTESTDKEDGTTISICPADVMTVQFNVDETDILAIEVGQTADVTISALGEDTYTAKITDLDTVGTSTDGTTTYTATLTLNKADGMLDGMSASAVITIEGKDNALLVPVEAVHKTSSTAYVNTSYDEQSGELGDMVEVICGLSNSKYIEITSGLSEGDTVYYAESEEDDRRRDEGGMGLFGSMGGNGGAQGPGGNGGGDRPGGGNRSSGGNRPGSN